jgi:ABC-type sugar transport system ATPase subunit
MTTLTLTHVSKKFQQYERDGSKTVIALSDISLKVNDGEVLGVVGPSGCGKSTLLRIAAGLTSPDKGDVLYDNVPLETIEPIDRGIGMVFQEGALMPHWEAQKTVGFHLSLKHREHEVPARVKRISQITGVGLELLMDRRPSKLSGGERQRVAVARALARDPRVFLFDEPFSNIDAKLRGIARVELRRLLNEFPVTSMYVTHDQHEAIALCNRIAVMNFGYIEQIGTFQQLYASPVSQFVAQFIGTPPINIFEGYVQGHEWHGKNFSGLHVRHDLPDGAAVNLGVHSEAIQIHDDGENAVVRNVIPFYAERYALVEVESRGESWSIMQPLDIDTRRGDVLKCVLNPDSLYFFDAKTGKRIG